MNSAIVCDIDGTLCGPADPETGYTGAMPHVDTIEALARWRAAGYRIVLFTARGMRTHRNNVGAVIADRAYDLIGWLRLHNVPFDELHFGKPWCGADGFYVDDRAIRPREFVSMRPEELEALVKVDAL